MPLRIYATAIVALAFLVGGTAGEAIAADSSGHAVASKAKKHKRKKCKRGYHGVKRHGKRVCVKRRKKLPVPAARTVRLQAHLSPTVKRNPLNPFEATYDISASATTTQEEAGVAALSEPTPPPEGVLALYSDGMLACAVNVGPETVGDECPVTYDALGAHRVTTIYTAGTVSATDTRIDQVDPLTTTTTLSTSYEPTVFVFPEDGTAPAPGYYDQTKHAWRIGTLNITPAVSAPGTVDITLDGTPAAHGVAAPLQLVVWGRTPPPGAGVEYAPPCGPEEPVDSVGFETPLGATLWRPAASVDAGEVSLGASFAGDGYVASSADTALDFSPGSIPNREPPEPYSCRYWF
jgi:hypothetical protein